MLQTIATVISIVIGTISIVSFVTAKKKERKTLIYVGIILLLIAIGVGLWIIFGNAIEKSSCESANLTSPTSYSTFPQQTTVTGYAPCEPDTGWHLYVIVEYESQWWPQHGEVTMSYSKLEDRYEFTVPAEIGVEGDCGKTFVVRAVLVDESVHQLFQNWLQQETDSDEWSGISITDINQQGLHKILDSVNVTRQNETIAKITSPLYGSVRQTITTGYFICEPDTAWHAYVVVEYGGQWWPQSSEAIPGYSQTTKRYEFSVPTSIGLETDTGKTFMLRIVLVDESVHQLFQNWFQQGQATGTWLGINITEIDQQGQTIICDSTSIVRQ